MKQVNRIFFVVILLLAQQVCFAQSGDDPLVYDTVVTAEPAYEEDVPEETYPDTVTFRTIPDSVVAQLKTDKSFAYANDPAYWEKELARRNRATVSTSPSWFDRLVNETWFRRLVLVIMVALLVFAVVRIALSNRMFLRRSPRQYNMGGDDAMLQKENLDELIPQAEQQGNFRLAVRYRYMKALQMMDARGIIQLDARSTNWDYVNRLGNHPLKKQFLLLTRAYEYVWYGEFPLSEQQYGYLRTEFQQYNNSLA